ncbi:hypothetical protein D9758_010236 [Tetrapyrgos nigripes]|uniref:C2H2-type domain-containing protein n=1 Tax=Tetrapyrgos nigripes TaxID=182062 RepID=A0A8H5FUT7_9AGAR|nr:hypothetical protein D9758_010236 [Tetrapyrgos nigripes]
METPETPLPSGILGKPFEVGLTCTLSRGSLVALSEYGSICTDKLQCTIKRQRMFSLFPATAYNPMIFKQESAMTRSQTPAPIMAYNYTRDKRLYSVTTAGRSPAGQQTNIQHVLTPTTTVYPVNPSAGQGQSQPTVQMHCQKPNEWFSGHNLPANVGLMALNSTSQQHSANDPYYGIGSSIYGPQSAQSKALPDSRTYPSAPLSSMSYYADASAEETTWVGMNHVASGLNFTFLSPWDSPSIDSTVSPLALTTEFSGTMAGYPLMPHEISKHRVATDAVERAARMKRRISDTNKLFKCTVPDCPQTFTARHNLNFHLQSHRGVKVKCSQCGNEFAPSSYEASLLARLCGPSLTMAGFKLVT